MAQFSHPYAVRYASAMHQPTGMLLDCGRERVVGRAYSPEDALFLVCRQVAGTRFDPTHVVLADARTRRITRAAARRIPVPQIRLF